VLAVLILLLYLRNLKATFIIAVSIPISMLITVLCMYFAGLTLNTISLTGLIMGFGMVSMRPSSMWTTSTGTGSGERSPNRRDPGSQEMITAITGSTLRHSACSSHHPVSGINSAWMGQLFNDLYSLLLFARRVARVAVPSFRLSGPVSTRDTVQNRSKTSF
jgi:HAE1 family hydrophobic/amphiphilic exporter-1